MAETVIVGFFDEEGKLVSYQEPYRVTVLADTLRDSLTGMVVGVRRGEEWVNALLPTMVFAVEHRPSSIYNRPADGGGAQAQSA